MKTAIATVQESEFRAEAEAEDGSLTVRLNGNADTNSRAALAPFLRAVHDHVAKLQLQAVEVDVRKLEFMNSSCLKCFVSWITLIQELPQDRRYRILFASNPEHYWQRRSLHALSSLAPDLVTVSNPQAADSGA